MLNKLRIKLEPLLSKLALAISETPLTPNTLTLLSLLVVVAGVYLLVTIRRGLLLAVVVLISGFLDAVDGALARVTGKSTQRGALLDSLTDRVCEALFALMLLLLGLDPYIVLIFLTMSFLASYLRARGESLGVSLSGVGLMERAERLGGLLIVALILEFNYLNVANTLLAVLALLTGITVIHRFIYIWSKIGNTK